MNNIEKPKTNKTVYKKQTESKVRDWNLMKNKKIIAWTSGLSTALSAAVMLTTGIGVACAAPAHTQLNTTSSKHQPLKDSTLQAESTSSTATPVIDMNNVVQRTFFALLTLINKLPQHHSIVPILLLLMHQT